MAIASLVPRTYPPQATPPLSMSLRMSLGNGAMGLSVSLNALATRSQYITFILTALEWYKKTIIPPCFHFRTWPQSKQVQSTNVTMAFCCQATKEHGMSSLIGRKWTTHNLEISHALPLALADSGLLCSGLGTIMLHCYCLEFAIKPVIQVCTWNY